MSTILLKFATKKYFSLALRVTEEALIGASVVFPIFLIHINTALKGTEFTLLFAITADMPCGGRKKSPNTSYIVLLIEINEGFLGENV